MSKPDSNVVISAFTEDHVQRLTGVSKRQLRYWASDGFYIPSLKFEGTGLSDARLYSFRDLVCLKVVNSLRNDSKIPLSELRATKDRLSHLGDDLWAKTTLYVLNRKVVFDNDNTGEKEEVSRGQGVLQIPLKVVTGDMENAVYAMRQRSEQSIGKIEQKRGVAQNQPVVAGTRIPVRSIQAFAHAGYSIEAIIEQYPTLKKEDVESAILYKEVA